MSDIAIRVENLGKMYRIGAAEKRPQNLWQTAKSLAISPFEYLRRMSRPPTEEETLWALKDVSFEVKQGEVVGIIGRNGAGKTTLLKILSRITDPTEGRAVVQGRVGSLLEVGTGFHPELTGRENIYLNGAILGMKRAEIERKFGEIVDFSGVEKFIDTPVKRYSSGMYVRLAFAVAAHLEPEILLVDEVLAVGDAAFQKKCLGKMGDVAREGRTVLFVSHNMGAISSLTNNCIYLKDGQVSAYDRTPQVVERYLTETLEHRQSPESNFDFYRRDPSAEGTVVRFTDMWVNERSKELPIIEMGSSFSIFIEMEASREIQGANLSLIIKDIHGHGLVRFFSWDQDFRLFLSPGKHIIELRVDDLPSVPGLYFANMGINQSLGTAAYDAVIDFPLFQIVNKGQVTYWLERPWGSVHWDKIRWRLLR